MSLASRLRRGIAELPHLLASVVNRTGDAVEGLRHGRAELVRLALDDRALLRHLALERLPELS
ncbi:MAG: hypothetical protein ACR2NT_03445, partial [Acidimicrobiia bacterium]